MDTHQYLIIGGSTKCGTTSVFNYFEYHPQVCPCVMKESRYFWTGNYPLSKISRSQEKSKGFTALFKNCKNNQVRIEATPDYLYAAESALLIHKELQHCKLVFMLRNPLTRLNSWYRFAIVNGLLPKETTFESYILLQQNSTNENLPQHLRALEQGKYSGYIEKYLEVFGKEKILITYYEDLVANPVQLCSEIARFAGIDEHYFTDFDFKIFNKTVSAKSVGAHRLFRKFKRTVRPITKLFHSSIRKKLKLAGHKLETTYQSANKQSHGTEPLISPDMLQFLDNYYSQDHIKLQQLTGHKTPW